MLFFKRPRPKLPSELSLAEHNALIEQHAQTLESHLTGHASNRRHRLRNLTGLTLGIGVLTGIAAASTAGLLWVVGGGIVVAMAGGIEPVMEHVMNVLDGYARKTPGYITTAQERLSEAQATRDRFFPPTPSAIGAKLDQRTAAAPTSPERPQEAPITSDVLVIPTPSRARSRSTR